MKFYPKDTYNQYRFLAVLALVTIITGSIFYHVVEHLKWLDAVYFSVVTLATVGYGDIVPKTDLGKIFTVFYILVGIGIIAAFASSLVSRASRRREEKVKKRK